MCNGWPPARRLRRAARMLVIAALAVVAAGCAQNAKRPGGFFGGNAPRPLIPRSSATRPEPGLSVRAPFVDVQMAEVPADASKPDASKPRVVATRPEADASRVGLFRSGPTASGGSLGAATPLH